MEQTQGARNTDVAENPRCHIPLGCSLHLAQGGQSSRRVMKTMFLVCATLLLAGCGTNDRYYSGAPAGQRGYQTEPGFDDQFPYRSGPGLPSTDRQVPARSGPGGLGPDQ
jgi:hypothetical protein